MTQTHETTARTRDIIAAYGCDPKRWPAHERDAAWALATRDPDLRAALDEARALDAMLDRWEAPAADARAYRAPDAAGARRLPERAWVGGLLAASLLLGLLAGQSAFPALGDDADIVSLFEETLL